MNLLFHKTEETSIDEHGIPDDSPEYMLGKETDGGTD